MSLTLQYLSPFPEVHKGHCLQGTDFILACNLYSGVLILPRVMNSEDWTVTVALFFF